MREEFLELLSYIDFNCFSMTSMCIIRKIQKKKVMEMVTWDRLECSFS